MIFYIIIGCLFIFLLILIVLCLVLSQKLKKREDLNEYVRRENIKAEDNLAKVLDKKKEMDYALVNIQNELIETKETLINIKSDIKISENKKQSIEDNILELNNRTIELNNYLLSQQEHAEIIAQEALEKAIESADKDLELYKIQIKEKEKEEQDKYDSAIKAAKDEYLIILSEYIQQLQDYKDNYNNDLENIKQQIETEKYELDKIKATHQAAIEAQKKEEEIKNQLNFYSIQITGNDLSDILKLKRIKSELNNPRILSMLIWKTYIQQPMNILCANVLGADTITGIYKITNQKTGMCYIGQARDVRSRWIEHIKAGIGIDTPSGNLLYKAMQDYDITSFTWELLESCDRTELDEKEMKFIELYDSKNFGYNQTKGNQK